MSNPGDRVDWPPRVHGALRAATVSLVGYVPDAGHKRLIELCHADPFMRAVPLTTKEEGIGLSAGAWLGGVRCAILMQSSGVGKIVNALGMAGTCGFPLALLVTMRGEEGEANPWQVPVGRAAADLLSRMGVEVTRAKTPAEVGPAVDAALEGAYAQGTMSAVLIAQAVEGVKRFETGASR
jgi:sulfopyruvate decarboxylase alpha subunit